MSAFARPGPRGLAGGAAPGEPGDPEPGGALVDRIGIEGFAVALLVPFGRLVMAGMAGIGDGLQEGLEARYPADIPLWERMSRSPSPPDLASGRGAARTCSW